LHVVPAYKLPRALQQAQFTNRSQEYACEEMGDELVLMMDRAGRVIGLEKLNFSVPDSDSL
jgi:uncharacterized protein YuzE